MKIERIPELITPSCTDDSKSEQIKGNSCASAETVEMAGDIDGTSMTGSETSLPSVPSSSSLHPPCPKKLKQTQYTCHLTAPILDAAVVGTERTGWDGLSGLGGERRSPKYERDPVGTEEESSQISCGVNRETRDCHADRTAGVSHQPNTPQIDSASTSKAPDNVSVQFDNQSRHGVESVATSERQTHKKNKPQIVHIRRATDGPDQNCKTQ